MKGDERRAMEYRLENVGDAEDFVAECMTLVEYGVSLATNSKFKVQSSKLILNFEL